MSQLPSYEQLYRLLKKRISDGQYPPGYHFPPEMVLAKEFSVSRNTLRSALQMLENEFLITRLPSKGTFVMPYYENADSSRRLLVLCQRESNYYYPCHYILPGMVREAAIRGIELEIRDLSMPENFTVERMKLYLESARISGIILIASHFTAEDKTIAFLNALNIPVLQVHGRPEDHKITDWALLYVHTKLGWKQALQYLAQCGHKNIVTTYLTNSMQEIRRWQYDEYIALLKQLHLNTDSRLLVDFPQYDNEALKEKLYDIFTRLKPHPTAVMAFSDHHVRTIYQTLQALNLRVPEDVAVMGFCGIPDSEFMEPSLSTVNMHYQLMGARAIAIMATSEEWFQQPVKPLVEHAFTLTLRQSTNVKITTKG